MGRTKQRVSEKRAEQLKKKSGMHAMGGDPPGLYLLIDGRSRSWIFRYSFAGRRRDLGLGSCRDLSTTAARTAARKARDLVLAGVDPIEARRTEREARLIAEAKRLTFAQCVDRFLDAHSDGWRNPKHRAQWRATLTSYAGKVLGPLDVAAIDTGLVLRVLEPIWKTKTETASRLRGRIEAVLDWATVHRLRQGPNPAQWKGHLDKLLPAPTRVAKVRHHPALPFVQLGTFMEALRKQDGIAAAAVEFTILTAARSGETRGATWPELDLEGHVWTIPPERMKAKREHRVPLSPAAVAVLNRMKADAPSEEFVFPGAKEGRPLSDMALTAVLRRMNRGDITVHGFRSSFRDWAAQQTAYPQHVVEMALAHTISDKVEAAYRRGDLFAKRKRLMNDWARYCERSPADSAAILSIGGKR